MQSQKLTIGLYGDVGVAPNSYLQLQKTLLPFYKIVKLKALDVIEGNWPKEMAVIIMPGGADLPYHQKLQGQGCTNIRVFVEKGGLYLGICAGSYFASKYIHFTCCDGAVIQGARELDFFQGNAVGPAFGPYQEQGHSSAKLVPIRVGDNTYNAYFNGGGYFDGVDDSNVLGRYQNTNQPMALQCDIGHGKAFLCAVHPEYDQNFIDQQIAAKTQGYQALLSMAGKIHAEVKYWFLSSLANYLKNHDNCMVG